MPHTPSNPAQIGWQATSFSLPEPLTGKTVTLAEARGDKATLVAFISNVCPFVKLIEKSLVQFAADYKNRGLRVIAINSNAQEIKAGEDAEGVAKAAREGNYGFPYLRDETQTVAEAYGAACTPDLYLLDGAGHLFYRGQFDAARPGNGIAPSGADLRAAADALLSGAAAPARQTPSIGCNIKWRDGDDHGVRKAASPQRPRLVA